MYILLTKTKLLTFNDVAKEEKTVCSPH